VAEGVGDGDDAAPGVRLDVAVDGRAGLVLRLQEVEPPGAEALDLELAAVDQREVVLQQLVGVGTR